MAEQHASVASPPSRAIVADDHPLFRYALRCVLECTESIEVIAEAADGHQALEFSRTLKPDLVLMDVRMPKMGGLEATHAIKRELPQTVVLMLTAHEETSHLAEAIKAGAAGYVLKSATPQQISAAIHGALDGESSLDPEVARRLILDLMDEQSKNAPPSSSDVVAPGSFPSPALVGEHHSRGEGALPSSLTPREIEVLTLTAQGYTNQQIAYALRLSMSTVKKHLRGVISKLGVSDRTQAAVRAVELGVLAERMRK
jgi:DNA-binding NarL/FixJ family response regulator